MFKGNDPKLHEIYNQVHQNLTKQDIDQIYAKLKKMYSVYSNALSSLCVSKVTSSVELNEIWDILLKSIGKENMIYLIKASLKNRPLDLVKNSSTYRTILVLCIYAVILRDVQLMTLTYYVYGFIRFYSTFVSRIKVCDPDVMRHAFDLLTYKSIIKQKNGNYIETTKRVMDHFYNNYVQTEFNNPNIDDMEVIQKVLIMLDYSRTRLKEVQATLIKYYYQVYNNKDMYTNKPDVVIQNRINLTSHIVQIHAKFLQLCKSEVEHPIYSKNLVPESAAKCLASAYLKNNESTYEMVRLILSIIEKNIHLDPCEQNFSYQVRKLFTKKKLQDQFKIIDDANYQILNKCNLDISKWMAYMKKHNIYKISTRSYTLFLVYIAVTQTLCVRQ